ncbi:MAG: 1-acyl-sn-glycerol-3-phosphate acyltransferase [Candidatus Rokubacteria bacterium]|nr:1-acyl-sn-glycerol-3-phosphate acyltransferase [Candidatus Rokubacteria bacterium]MBI3825295.1 1-acyl-sn-glycerol-3-phosphate acyltransferase [Candidatus Rokubacteria bacterium]
MAPSIALPAGSRTAPGVAPLPLLYRTLKRPVRGLLERLFDLRVDGLDQVPAGQPYIVAANHHNYLDGVVLGAVLPTPISFLVMPRVYHATPLHPLLHRHLGSIRIDLVRPDVGALRRALGALDAGRVVGIFPEGPFSVRGRLGAGLPGVGLLALRSGVPVVPAAIRGTYEALVGRRFYVPRRHPLHVRFGPPRLFSAVASPNARAARANVTERIMADIATLLA